MDRIERQQDITPEQLKDHVPSLSIGQIKQFLEKKRLNNERVKADLVDTKPLTTFIENLRTLPSVYREPFARRTLEGILIDGEPLDLSGIHKTPTPIPSNER